MGVRKIPKANTDSHLKTTPKKLRMELGRGLISVNVGLLANASAYARVMQETGPRHVADWKVTDRSLTSDHQQLRKEWSSNLGQIKETAAGVLLGIILAESKKNPRVAINALAELRQTLRYDQTEADTANTTREAMDLEVQGWLSKLST